MVSRRRSQVFSRKGSMERSRASRLGFKGWAGNVVFVSEANVGGGGGVPIGGVEGSWWRSEVSRCELWTVKGSSSRMSWKRRPDFWRLRCGQ